MKKIIKTVIITLSLTLVLFYTIRISSDTSTNLYILKENEVIFNIASEKDVYSLYEDVWILSQLINNSPSNYYTKFSFDIIGVHFIIIDPKGNPLSNAVSYNYHVLDSIKVNPQEKIENMIGLNNYFTGYEIMEGKYKIQAEYQGIKSNEIYIEFVKPTGTNLEVYNIFRNKLQGSIHRDEVDYYLPIIKQYPNSVYSLQLYRNIILRLIQKKYSAQIIEDEINYCLNNYSNDYGIKSIVALYEEHQQRKNIYSSYDQIGKLNELKFQYRGTMIERIVHNYLQNYVLKLQK